MRQRQRTKLLITLLALALLTACAAPELDLQPWLQKARERIDARLDFPAAPGDTMSVAGVSKRLAASATLPLDEEALVALYERANPAVVNIRVVAAAEAGADPRFAFPDLPGFDWPELPGYNSPTPGPRLGSGSGFVYDAAGHIVTNHHVVGGADRIVVTFADGREVDAELVGSDPDSDLAVLKVTAEDLVVLPLGDSSELMVGQLVVAIGNPFGLNGSMTTGIVSGLGRMLPSGARTANGARFSIPDVIQTDAAINPGNSGGPLINLAGQAIGVNTAIESPVRGFMGVGYAVPANTVAEVVPQLIAQGYVEHPWLGIAGTTLTRDLAQAMGLAEEMAGGVLITDVVADGPADAAGLRGSAAETMIDGFSVRVGGDIIRAIDGVTVQDFDDLLSYIVQEGSVGADVTLEILRDGQETLSVTVTLGSRPGDD